MTHNKRSKKQNAAIHAKKGGVSSTQLTAYDVAAKKKVTILKPIPVKLKNGVWAIKGNSSATGNKVYRIVGKKKPTL